MFFIKNSGGAFILFKGIVTIRFWVFVEILNVFTEIPNRPRNKYT